MCVEKPLKGPCKVPVPPRAPTAAWLLLLVYPRMFCHFLLINQQSGGHFLGCFIMVSLHLHIFFFFFGSTVGQAAVIHFLDLYKTGKKKKKAKP